MLRGPLTSDNVSVLGDAEVVEPTVAGSKKLQPKVDALETSELNEPWPETPKLKEAEAEASKLEELRLVVYESQGGESKTVESQACGPQASSSQPFEPEATGAMNLKTKASKKKGRKSKIFEAKSVEPKDPESMAAKIPPSGTSISEAQRGEPSSCASKTDELSHPESGSSTKPKPKASELKPAELKASRPKASASKDKDLKTTSEGKAPASTLNDIQSTIERLEATALANAIMHEADEFAASGETIRVYGNFSHLGLEPGKVELGDNGSRFRAFEVVREKPGNNTAGETSIGKADASKLLKEARCVCVRWPREAKPGTAEKGKREGRKGRKETR